MIQIKLINITVTFPTKLRTKFTHKTYLKKVSKGNTDAELFKFVRIPDKKLVCRYKIEVISVVGSTNVVGS